MAHISTPTELNPIAERDFVLLLISLYRNHPELWQIESKDYLNKNKRKIAIQEILDVLKNYKPDYNEEKLKKKINILRTNFNKECQKMEQRKRLGTGSNRIPEPTLWYYNDLLFIKDQVVIKSEYSEQSLIEEQRRPSPRKIDVPKKKKKQMPSAITEELTASTTSYFKRPENEADILAKGWVIKLSRIAPEQRRYAEKIINDTLFEAEMGTLTRHGVSFLTSSSTLSAPYVSAASSVSATSSVSSASSVKD